MTLPFALRLAPLAILLAGCGQTLYFAPPPTVSDVRVNVRADTVQINDVSMPESIRKYRSSRRTAA